MFKIEWRSCIRIAVTTFLTVIAIHYWTYLASFTGKLIGAATPFIIGLCAAFVLNILMSFFERHYFPKSNGRFANGSRRVVSLVLAIVTLLGAVSLVIGLVIPELISCIKFIISEIPPVIQTILKSDLLKNTLPADLLKELSAFDWKTYLSDGLEIVLNGIGGAADIIFTTVTSIFSGVVTALLSVIFTVYLLLDCETLKGQSANLIKTYLPKRFTDKLFYVLSVLNKCFRRYIVGQCTEAVILGVLCTLGMLIMKIPYAGMVGALIGFTALIPIAGAYIGASVGTLMILTASPGKALLFLVYIIVLQQIEGNFIYPKVVGKSIGLPALWVLAAVTVGGGLFGVGGMLIGVPLTAAIYRIVRADVHTRRANAAPFPESAASSEGETVAETSERSENAGEDPAKDDSESEIEVEIKIVMDDTAELEPDADVEPVTNAEADSGAAPEAVTDTPEDTEVEADSDVTVE